MPLALARQRSRVSQVDSMSFPEGLLDALPNLQTLYGCRCCVLSRLALR